MACSIYFGEQPGEARHILRDFFALRAGELVALFQRLRVFTVSEVASLLRDLLDGEILQVGRQQVVIPRGGDEGRQKKDKAIVGAPIRKSHRGKQHDAVEVDLVAILNHAGQFGGACSAVAFADQVFRRRPSRIARDVLVDEIGEPVGIGNDAVKLRGIFARSRPAVAGRNGVDEDQIGGVEEGIFVVDRRVGRGHAVAVRCQHHALWPHAHVREERSGAGAAVVDERNRAPRWIHAVFGVGHIEHRRFGCAVVGFDDVSGGGGGVGDLLAANASGVMGHRRFFFRREFLLFG